MLNNFEQITLERELTPDEMQRYIFKLVEKLNYDAGDETKVVEKQTIQQIINTGGDIEIDDELSTTSENAVQNKVITNELDEKLDDDASISLYWIINELN